MYEFFVVMFSTFTIVFVGELGDKTQMAAGLGALANRQRTRWIFFGSASALTCVAFVTTFLAGLIPQTVLPTITLIGGAGLILYGLYLAVQAFRNKKGHEDGAEGKTSGKTGWLLFLSQFAIVFLAELGDKTQIFTAGSAIKNNRHLIAVFLGSAMALVSVTGLTVWGASFVPLRWIRPIQVGGALTLMGYGITMVAC